MATDIQDVLQRLDRLIGDGPAHCRFNDPASSQEIRALEKRLSIRLPASYKAFLEFTNGGMIMSESLYSLLQKDNDLDTIKWNANYLYSLEELEENYRSMSSWNLGYPGESIIPFPFIPFCHTTAGEQLVFVNLKNEEKESPVLDAFHEDIPEEYGLVADSFTEFLDEYIDTNGYPDVLGDLADGSAADYLNELATDDEEPSPEQIIFSTTEELSLLPEDAWLYAQRGTAFHQLRKYEKGLNDLSKAIELDPDDPYYYFLRGNLYSDVKKKRAALIDYDIAVKLAPDDCLYLDCRATALFEMEKFDKALADVDRAIEIDAEDILAHMIRANIFRAREDYDKAEEIDRLVEELKAKKNPKD